MKNSVQLRPWQTQDAQALALIINNRKIWNNLRDSIPNPYNVMDALQWMNLTKDQKPEQNLAILYKGVVVGNIGCMPQTDIHRKSLEIGYFVAEEYWGKGIATKAVEQFVSYICDKFQPVRIYAVVFDHNRASMQVLHKNGFILESIRRCSAIKNNQILDDYVWVKFV
ncbi:MAG: GNAT family N-acetyltransferase [Chitinophagaceae bacterium]|nr:GNAT family N-acetyltransferase [Chitinophagaceae bacterium]